MKIKNIKIESIQINRWNNVDEKIEFYCRGELEGQATVAVWCAISKEERALLLQLVQKAEHRIKTIGEEA
jgi:hypothetical protein